MVFTNKSKSQICATTILLKSIIVTSLYRVRVSLYDDNKMKVPFLATS